jgi:hypothetical protein
MRAQLRPDLDDNLTLCPGMEQRIDRREMILELHVDDAPAYRSYGADIGEGFATHLKGGSHLADEVFFEESMLGRAMLEPRSLLSEKDLAIEIRT